MGVSTNAYLFYGIQLTDMEDGLFNIKNALIDSGVMSAPMSGDEEEFGIYEIQELLSIPEDLSLDFHGSSEYPAYYLWSTQLSASRGYPTEVGKLPTQSPGIISKLRHYAKLMGVEAEPSWILASYWG